MRLPGQAQVEASACRAAGEVQKRHEGLHVLANRAHRGAHHVPAALGRPPRGLIVSSSPSSSSSSTAARD